MQGVRAPLPPSSCTTSSAVARDSTTGDPGCGGAGGLNSWGPGQSRAQGSGTPAQRPQRPCQVPRASVLASRTPAQPRGRPRACPGPQGHPPPTGPLTFPQLRQWCFRRMTVKGALQAVQKPHASSGTHSGGSGTVGMRSAKGRPEAVMVGCPPSLPPVPGPQLLATVSGNRWPHGRRLCTSPQGQTVLCHQPGHQHSGCGLRVSTRMVLSLASLCQHPAWQTPWAEVVAEKRRDRPPSAALGAPCGGLRRPQPCPSRAVFRLLGS